MADTIQMKLVNARAVQDALNAFEKKIAERTVKNATKAAWTPLLKRAKTNARNLSGKKRKGVKKSTRIGNRIAKALVLKPFKKQMPNQYGMKIYIDPKQAAQFVVESKSGQRNYIPVAIEHGHAFPYRGKGPGGGAPKDVAARPFMRPALDATLPNAPKIFERHLVHAIHEENAKK